jgi:pSer/pThr/pTyr-binding forkhead associated (FHA) protein
MTGYALILEKGQAGGADRFELAPGEHIIGRSHSAAIVLEAPDVSGRHVRLVVDESGVSVENLSKYGSILDDRQIDAVQPMRPGQRLFIGMGTVLVLEGPPATGTSEETPTSEIPAAASPPGATGGVAAGATVGAAAGTRAGALDTRAAAAPSRTGHRPAAAATRAQAAAATGAGGHTMDDATRGFAVPVDGGADLEGVTRAMQTRVAGAEELDYLRLAERAAIRNRTRMTLGVGVVVLALALFLWPRKLPPETEIEWPADAEGNFIDAMLPGPSGGLADGGYDLAFPGVPGWESAPLPGGGLHVVTRVGRDRDVPLHIRVEEHEDVRYLRESREDTLRGWIEEVATEGRWNFDPPGPPIFIGRENGVPCLSVVYQRAGSDGNWFGRVNVFRYGARRVVLWAEVPDAVRVKSYGIVSKGFFALSPQYERGHWEGRAQAPDRRAADLLATVRPELDRMAPATWVRVEGALLETLRAAAIEGDAESLREGTRLLVDLRERQAVWFNAQRLARWDAQTQRDVNRVDRITELCKGVFSNMEDRRYYAVRRAQW